MSENLTSVCSKCHGLTELKEGMERSSIARLSDEMKSRLARIAALLTLKDGKTRSMEDILELLADAYEEKEKK
jgi:hypothetical protein